MFWRNKGATIRIRGEGLGVYSGIYNFGSERGKLNKFCFCMLKIIHPVPAENSFCAACALRSDILVYTKREAMVSLFSQLHKRYLYLDSEVYVFYLPVVSSVFSPESFSRPAFTPVDPTLQPALPAYVDDFLDKTGYIAAPRLVSNKRWTMELQYS